VRELRAGRGVPERTQLAGTGMPLADARALAAADGRALTAPDGFPAAGVDAVDGSSRPPLVRSTA
jgi:hypothetical protein